MASSRHLVALTLLALVTSAIEARQVGPKRLSHQRRAVIKARQNNGGGGILPISIPDDQSETTSRVGGAPVTASPPAAVTTSSPPAIIEITISSSPPAAAPPPATSTITPVTVTTSSTVAQPTTPRSTVRQVTSQTTVGNSVVNVTLTSTIDAPSTSASAVPQVQDNSKEEKSGIGKGTLIAIIVVASSCAGVFILWTIFRRWKLKPTRNFEERLQPIDFGPGEKGAYEPMGSTTSLNRNGSLGSNGSVGEKPLRRQDSFGSLAGSQRGGGGSVRGGSVRGGPAASETGSRSGYAPSYPPSSNGGWSGYAQQVPAHQMPYNPASPPRLANPYGTDYGATHGIARSDTMQSSQYGGGGAAYGRYS